MTAVLFAAFDMYQWALAYQADRFHNDFTFYYAAARIGIANGWGAIYDLSLQQGQLDAIGSRIKIAALARYISPPPVAWLAAPLSGLPYSTAYWIWSALLVAALVAAWHLAAPGHRPWKLAYLAAAIGWLPVIYGLQLGQPGIFVGLGVAACYALLRAQRPFVAGVALGALALKPQLGFLVPAALLLGGRTRAFWGSVAVLGLLAAASAFALGPGGIAAYEARLSFAAGVPVNRELTLATLIPTLTATRAVQALIAVWSLLLAYRVRRRGHEWVFVPALVGGMLASPYLHLDDLVMFGLAGWLYLRTEPRPWTVAFVFAVAIAAEGIPIWGPAPVVVGEVAALALLSVAALKAEDRDPEHDRAERKHDSGLERESQQVTVDGQAQPVDDPAGNA